MGKLEDDIKYADEILNGKNKDTFGFLYSRTNEDLVTLFNKVNVVGKSVYTTLSSADLLFSSYAKEATQVDAFDINPLTYRYYYLRKWLLEKNLIDADGLSLSMLLQIVNNQKTLSSEEEKNSQYFWRDYISKIDNFHFYSNVLFEYIPKPNVPYKSYIPEIVTKLKTQELKFDEIDICSKIDIGRKYDMVFISNILDYNRSQERMEVAYENVLRILNHKGKVICTSMLQDEGLILEKDIFSTCFHYDELFTEDKETQKILYYQYTLK